MAKSKYVVAVCYQEDVFDLIPRLELLSIPCAVSPLHSPEDGKKEHWHLLGERKCMDTICSIFKLRSFDCLEPFAYYEYLTHKNDPDKEQFDKEPYLIADFVPPVSKTKSNKKMSKAAVLARTLELLDEYQFVSYRRFLKFICENEDEVYINGVMSNTYSLLQLFLRE